MFDAKPRNHVLKTKASTLGISHQRPPVGFPLVPRFIYCFQHSQNASTLPPHPQFSPPGAAAYARESMV